jgi:magnesium-transporting ATPase (P-type)
MTFVGVLGIRDPPRPEAGNAIIKCKEAGVRIMMMTGDSKETAISIAKDVNIFTVDDDPIGPLTHSLTHSLTYLLTYLLTHSLTYLLTHLLTYSLTHLLTHSPTH